METTMEIELRNIGGQPLAVPVEGRIRKGVMLEQEDEKHFIFLTDQRGLACYRLKFSENGVRATAVMYTVPKVVLAALLGENP